MKLNSIPQSAPSAGTPSEPTTSQKKGFSRLSDVFEPHNNPDLAPVFSRYGVGWVAMDDGSHFVVRAHVLDIEAPIETVWSLVKDVNDYKTLSQNAATAHIDGDLRAGTTITLHVYPDKCVGHIMRKSVEKVTVVDDDMKIVGWSRTLPLGLGTTQRFHILVPIGPNLTRSYIALKVPGISGAFSSALFGDTVRKSFDALNHGIKRGSELTL